MNDFENFTKVYTFQNHSIPIFLRPGKYLFECWGAQGNNYTFKNQGGKGAYTSGIINFRRKRQIYLFIGEYGKSNYQTDTFNGGSPGQFGGGGATDIRIVDGNWDDLDSLKSRIMVAAAGGGPDGSENGGAGGRLFGIDSDNGNGKGANQTHGGIGYDNGSFGKGGGHVSTGELGNGGGGSGYYGGGSSQNPGTYAGGGGSSFISGHPGCDAIDASYTEDNPKHTGQPIHYSGLFFTNTQMIDGNNEMPSPTGGTEIGHLLNGAVRISCLGDSLEFSCKPIIHTLSFYCILLFIFVK